MIALFDDVEGSIHKVVSIRRIDMLLNIGDNLFFNTDNYSGYQLCYGCGHFCVYGSSYRCCNCGIIGSISCCEICSEAADG